MRPAVARLLRASTFTSLALLCASCGGTPDYVGSRDCKQLEPEVDRAYFATICERCQGGSCDDGLCASVFPCLEGEIVVQGCDEDSDCAKLPGSRCGMHSAPNHICTVADDDL